MKLPTISLLISLHGSLAQAALVVPGHAGVSDGLFSYRAIDIIGSGTDSDVNNTTEAQTILSTIGTDPGPGIIGPYGFAFNTTGTTGTVDNGATSPGNYTVGQLPLNPGAHFVIRYFAGIYFPEGDYSIYANGDDGHSITIPGVTFINRFGNVNGAPNPDELRYEDPTGSSNQGAQFSIGPGGLVTTIEAVWYERTGGDFFEIELRTGFGTKGIGADPEWDILSEDADGSGIAINSSPFVPVPEPSGVFLLALGSLIATRRRR